MSILTGYRFRRPRPWSSTTWARPIVSDWREVSSEPWEKPQLTGFRRWLEVHDDELETAGKWVTRIRVVWCWPTLCRRRWTWTVCLDPRTGWGTVEGEADTPEEAKAAADAELRRLLAAWDGDIPEPASKPVQPIQMTEPPPPTPTWKPAPWEEEQLTLFGAA